MQAKEGYVSVRCLACDAIDFLGFPRNDFVE